jgi:hypothetical protein
MWAWLLFRMFSRNVYRRRAENSRWLTIPVEGQKLRQRRPGAPRGQGPQVLHLQELQDHLPRAGGQGQNRHHLPQVRRADPRKDLTSEPPADLQGAVSLQRPAFLPVTS